MGRCCEEELQVSLGSSLKSINCVKDLTAIPQTSEMPFNREDSIESRIHTAALARRSRRERMGLRLLVLRRDGTD